MKMGTGAKLRLAGALLVASSVVGMACGASADTTFPQTGYKMWGPFEEYWKAHGGLAQFGVARTSVYPGGADYDGQWFERALFTYNPSKPDPYKVELQLLGNMATEARRTEAPFVRKADSKQGLYFPETGHNLTGKVRDYWQSTGGLPIYGYPISEAFMEVSKSDGKSYLVQYFERNRLEYHPENAGTQFEVQLGLLGSELLDKQGGPQAIEALGQPKYYPAGSGGIRVPPGGMVGTPGATPPGGTSVPAAPALPATTRPVLFSDDFTVGNMVGWSPEVPPDQSDEAPAMWRVQNGILEQYPSAAMEATALEALLVTSPGDYPDATLEIFVYPAGEFVGAVIRHSAAGYYLLQLSGPSAGNEPKARLILVTPQGPQTIKSSSTYAGFKPVTWQKITLTAKGSTITAAVDDVQLFSAQDTVLTHGAAGLYAHADGVAKFDNVRVTTP